jgi:Mrp family chromosome partitioning ATPase
MKAKDMTDTRETDTMSEQMMGGPAFARPGEDVVAVAGSADLDQVLNRMQTPVPRPGGDVTRDAVRYLLNRHELTARDGGPSSVAVVAVVAAQSGDGASTVASALSEIIAYDFGLHTCLLDMSWLDESSPSRKTKRRSARPDTDPAATIGLAEILAGTCTVAEALATNSRGTLCSLGRGAMETGDPRALGRGPKFDAFVAELRTSCDALVIDFPPVIGSGAALSLMRHIDASILVVRHGSTTTDMAQRVNDELGTIPSLGAVLNQFKSKTPRFIDRRLAG